MGALYSTLGSIVRHEKSEFWYSMYIVLKIKCLNVHHFIWRSNKGLAVCHSLGQTWRGIWLLDLGENIFVYKTALFKGFFKGGDVTTSLVFCLNFRL